MTTYPLTEDGVRQALLDEIASLNKRVEELEFAAAYSSSRLGTLSMGTEGDLRARICMALNLLRVSLGRGLCSIAGNMPDEGYEAEMQTLLGLRRPAAAGGTPVE